jgi:protoheme IX farnesyltransferase
MKLRLASLVVISSTICYILASESIEYSVLLALIIGGFLLTGSSNGFNEIIERDLDALMSRTESRPLPAKRMGLVEATIIASLAGVIGIGILGYFVNPMSGLLGALAILLYVAAYTPLKRITPFSVFIGAFPGSIPTMIGCVAATEGFGQITFLAWLMFAVQFVWQFPHFWAIAWRLDDDYRKAGFKMLPSPMGRDKASAFQVLVYTLTLIPISLLPVFFEITGNISLVIAVIMGSIFTWQAYRLYSDLSAEAATKLMFGSFIYLPVVQLAYMFDKLILG